MTQDTRKAYVDARIAAAFGSPDIEGWLTDLTKEGLPGNYQPWFGSGMERHIREQGLKGGISYHLNDRVRTLISCLSPLQTRDLPPEVPRDRKRAFTADIVMKSLNPLTWVFVAEEFDRVLLRHDKPQDASGFLVVRFDSATDPHGLAMGPETDEDVLRFLISEVTHGRPKANEAFRWLTKTLRAAIATERKAAEDAFKYAVAVSEDGTRIVEARYVLVVNEGGVSARLYSDSGFSGTKIGIPAGPAHDHVYEEPMSPIALCKRFMTERQARADRPEGFAVVKNPGAYPATAPIYVVNDHALLPDKLPGDGTLIEL